MRRETLFGGLLAASLALAAAPADAATEFEMPWRAAGLDERQAAAHLLSRLTFGPRPGEVDRVVALGLETWFEGQLGGHRPEPELDALLVELEPLFLSVGEVAQRYPNPGAFFRQALEEGVLPEDFDPQNARASLAADGMRADLMAFGRERGYRPQRELVAALMSQKVLRAVHAENQLLEVMTDFWFNHFNVSLTDNQARAYVLAYERDAIRPYVLGAFRDLLGATARHPAMLLYLDNAQSTAEPGDPTTLDQRMASRWGPGGARRLGARGDGGGRERSRRGSQGLNENYARELLELHTLGVDGGYTQDDVLEVARAFSGWTALRPEMLSDPAMAGRVRRALSLNAGFVVEDGFVFRADAHDAGVKKVLGQTLRGGRGVEDGEEVLDIVAAHPATADHLARKIAVRFVSDAPPAVLVERLAATWRASNGQIERVMRELVAAPEFWASSPAAATPGAAGDEAGRERAGKLKSPFELAASALRALDAEIVDPRALVEWIERMGQPLYAYQAPTGYPDSSEFWVSGGALLNRMNFGLALAAGRVAGVRFDLAQRVGDVEPESRVAALETFIELLLPGRPTEGMVELLEPMVMAPDLIDRITAASVVATPEPWLEDVDLGPRRRAPMPPVRSTPPTALEQVAGVILGSPEFQRR